MEKANGKRFEEVLQPFMVEYLILTWILLWDLYRTFACVEHQRYSLAVSCLEC